MQEIAKAIQAVMAEVDGVEKGMTVGTGASSYKGVADKDVKLLMRTSMLKHGLSILPIEVNPKIQIDRWEEETQYGNKTKQSVFTEVDTKYLLLHTSGESIILAGYGHGIDSQDKGAGKATTYALKNTLLNMFLVPTGVDTDDTHSDDLPVPTKTATTSKPANNKPANGVDTPSGGVKPKALTSPDEFCPTCGEECETKKGTTKEGKPYELGTCPNHTEPLKFFINRKAPDLSNTPF